MKEDFAKLKEAFTRQEAAAGMFSGENTPADQTAVEKPKKEFSPLPPGLQGYAEKFTK